MFVLEASFVCLLEAVAARCGLPHVGFVREIDPDGECLVGVELDLPHRDLQAIKRTRFFWSAAREATHAREQAAFQAVVFLQNVFGFVVSYYGHESMFFRNSLELSFLKCV